MAFGIILKAISNIVNILKYRLFNIRIFYTKSIF
jgi:hypothetical protein